MDGALSVLRAWGELGAARGAGPRMGKSGVWTGPGRGGGVRGVLVSVGVVTVVGRGGGAGMERTARLEREAGCGRVAAGF